MNLMFKGELDMRHKYDYWEHWIDDLIPHGVKLVGLGIFIFTVLTILVIGLIVYTIPWWAV